MPPEKTQWLAVAIVWLFHVGEHKAGAKLGDMRQKLKRRWGCRQELAKTERKLSNSSVVCSYPSTSIVLRWHCHPTRRQQQAGCNLVLSCSELPYTIFSLKPKDFWSKHLKYVGEERASGRAEYFLRPRLVDSEISRQKFCKGLQRPWARSTRSAFHGQVSSTQGKDDNKCLQTHVF